MKKWEQIQGVYIHTPFCLQKCLYCDFASYAGFDDESIEAYINSVCKEIVMRAGLKKVAKEATIYFGGGTPSLLPIDGLSKIVKTLKKHGFWQDTKEATIEVNPGTADINKILAFKDLGFDRISFGVQSLNDKELQSVGRIHTAKEAMEAIEFAKKAGFKRINADLIYGLPGQTISSLKYNMRTLLEIGIEHLSVYGLNVEAGTPLERLVENGKLILPNEDVQEAMYDLVQEYFLASKLSRYEISNYATIGQESLHNLVYWHYLPYQSFGAAACSYDGTRRFTATTSVKEYIESVAGGEIMGDLEELSMETMLGEYIFMGLRTVNGINLTEAQDRFGVDILTKYQLQIEKIINEELVIYDEPSKRLSLTSKGFKFGNRVFEIFVN